MNAWRRVTVAFLIGITSASYAGAQTWIKRHFTVNTKGVSIAEYTIISTKESNPNLIRILLKDSAGRLFVLRNEVNGTAVKFSVAAIESGHKLTFEGTVDGTATMNYDGQSVAYGDGEENSAATRQSAAALIGPAPQNFKDGLRQITILGLNNALHLWSFAYTLRSLLFYDLPESHPSENEALVSLDKNFNPNAESTPSPFDIQFGSAYYE